MYLLQGEICWFENGARGWGSWYNLRGKSARAILFVSFSQVLLLGLWQLCRILNASSNNRNSVVPLICSRQIAIRIIVVVRWRDDKYFPYIFLQLHYRIYTVRTELTEILLSINYMEMPSKSSCGPVWCNGKYWFWMRLYLLSDFRPHPESSEISCF